jgi:predicted neuraminidase
MRLILIFSLALSLSAFPAIAAEPVRDGSQNVEVERVVGPEFPCPYKHPASITELDNGDLMVAYYGGSDEYGIDTAVYGVRKKKGEKCWSDPFLLADTPNRSEGNPVIWQAPDGVLWLFYVNRYADTWSSARVKAKMSEDDGETWSDSFMLSMEEGTMVKGLPIVLNNGDYLIPAYHETGEDTERTAEDTCSYFFRYNPKTKVWSESSRIMSPTGNLQPEVVQISDDHLICYIRRGGNFLPTEDGYAIRSESHDGGHTWSEGKQTEFKNPNSALAFIKLQNGHLLMVYNDNMNERTPLTVAVSTDEDKTYPHRRDIMGGDNTYAYPYAIQTKDGMIHMVCTTNSRTTVLHITFPETAITEWIW